MSITIRQLFIVAICFLLFLGVWQILNYAIVTSTYKTSKKNDEKLFDFCLRMYNHRKWQLYKILRLSWYFNTKCYLFFSILKCIILVFITLFLLFVYFYVDSSIYGVWLNIEL